MAHLIAMKLNQLTDKKPVKCNKTCKYWKFPHLDTACELSSVFSVAKGMPCYEYQPKEKEK